jgi:DNA-binding transcriptional regulator YhcF (GntR family)
MTITEIINTVFSRNISEDHFLPSDIKMAKSQYVDSYISGYDEDSIFYIDYCRPVVAYGVVVNTFHRLSSEISDRGIVEMVSDGSRLMDREGKAAILREYEMMLQELIDTMLTNATGANVLITNDDLAVNSPVQFTARTNEQKL